MKKKNLRLMMNYKKKVKKNLEKSLKNLLKDIENINNININEIADNYINEEVPKIECEYQSQIKIIDEKNKIIEENFEYIEKEKALKNNIKNY